LFLQQPALKCGKTVAVRSFYIHQCLSSRTQSLSHFSLRFISKIQRHFIDVMSPYWQNEKFSAGIVI